MSKNNKKIIWGLFVALASAFTSQTVYAAQNTPIQLKYDPNAKEMERVNELYGDYLKNNPDIKIETGLVVLDQGKVGSIIIRFTGANMCRDKSCWTVILRHNGQVWKTVFSHTTKTLALGAASIAPGGQHTFDLIVDDRTVWKWTGLPTYQVDFKSLGTVADAKGDMVNDDGTKVDPKGGPASKEIAAAAAGILYQEIGGRSVGAPEIKFYSTPINIGASNPTYYVVAQASDICGLIGCPATILTSKNPSVPLPGRGQVQRSGLNVPSAAPVGKIYESVVNFPAPGIIAVMPTNPIGSDMHDIAIPDIEGYHVISFNKNKYETVATSYHSAITPLP